METIQEQIFAKSHNDVLSLLLITLLKRVIYREDDETLWDSLLQLQIQIRDYVKIIGLDLLLDEAEGYAFLKSRHTNDDEDNQFPRLIARRPLSYSVSLLLALLRKKLAEFDAHSGERRLILSKNEIVELIRVFLPESSNETKIIDQIETHINKIVDLGFLRRIKGMQDNIPNFEVRRILKAFIDAQWLSDLDIRLASYQLQPQGKSNE